MNHFQFLPGTNRIFFDIRGAIVFLSMIPPFPRTGNGPGLGFLGKMVFQNWLVLYIGVMVWFIMVAVQVFEAAD